MTKKESIEKTIAHWKWLSEQPDDTYKDEYPEFKDIAPWDFNCCFLCKYRNSHSKTKSGTCPVFGRCSYQCESNPEYSKWGNNRTATNAKAIYLRLLKFYTQHYGNLK